MAMDANDEKRSPRLSRRQLLENSLVIGAVAALPAVVAACGGSGSSDGGGTTVESPPASSAAETGATADTGAVAGQPVSGGRLRVGMPIPSTDNLDPQNFVESGDKLRAFNVTERLAMINPDGSAKLHLAESVEPLSEDAMSWRVTLRPDITYTNGKDLTAGDVLYSWQRLIDQEIFASALAPFVDLKNSKAVDDLTLEFSLLRPLGDFQTFIAGEVFGIFPEGSNTFEKPEDLVGTGPFTLAEWTPGERYLMVKNPNYWEDGKPYLDEVEVLNLTQEDDQAGALLSGQIDGTSGLPEEQIRQLDGNPDAKFVMSPGFYSPTWYMRLDSKAFEDVRVRQAFKLAIDREQCVQVQFGGRGQPGNDIWGELFPSFNEELPQREYDPEQARSLLKQAGQDGIEVELVCANYVDSATAFAQQAKQAGINISINPVPFTDIYNTDLYYLKVPFGETLWTGSFEATVPAAYLSDAFYNETAWINPEFDARFLEAYGMIDEATRLAIYAELQEQLWNEGGYIVWGFADLVTAVAPDVNGVVPWGTVQWWNGLRFEDIWRSA